MDIKIFPPNELVLVLRAMRDVAIATDQFTDGERALLEGIARIHEMEIDVDALLPIPFEDVAAVVTDPHRRKRAVQLAIVMALVEGKPSVETDKAVAELAKALDIDESGVDVIRRVANDHWMLARVDMFRRFTKFIRGAKNFPGVLGMALPMIGIGGVNEAMAAPYKALQHCAPGTLGRAVHDFFSSNGFKFPGEPGGIPLVFHDIGHVLAGYSTDPQGEIQQAAFQAGFARKDGFTFLLFGILQFHLGMRITPVAKGYEGFFDEKKVVEALRRGAACTVDFTEAYDLFADKDVPIEDVRARLGIPPLAA